MEMRYRNRTLASLLSWVLLTQGVWAAPSNTMSVTPACTSGTTILCSDETTRNNNISTPYNAHSHTDIAAMSGVNTFTIGDGTSGNKDYCEDSATDRCIRWDESAGLWTVQQGGTTYNQIATFSSTAGISAGFILAGNGTGSIVALTSAAPADDAALIGDSATAATWRALANCTDTGGNHLNYTAATNTFSCGTSSSAGAISSKVLSFSRAAGAGTGSASYTGMGFNPKALTILCGVTGGNAATSIGVSDGTTAGSLPRNATNWSGLGTTYVIRVENGADGQIATMTSHDTDGFTLSWTREGAGLALDCLALGER